MIKRARALLIAAVALGLATATAAPALADTAPPSTPASLLNNSKACTTDQAAAPFLNVNLDLDLSATAQDTATNIISMTYKIWPLSDPTQATSYTLDAGSGTNAPLRVPGSAFTDGQAYAWAAQAADNAGNASAWSATCYFIVDDTNPAAPAVSSPNYPADANNQGGSPVVVNFAPNGVSDAAGYIFSWSSLSASITNGPDPTTGIYTGPYGYVPAPSLGAAATARLIPPPGGITFSMRLTVISVDRAGNISPEVILDIGVKENQPAVTDQTPNAGYGENAWFHVTPDPGLEAVSPVTSYLVSYQGQGSQKSFTVHAYRGGGAEFSVALDDPNGVNFVSVQSMSADGWPSQSNQQWLPTQTMPTVSSDTYPEWQSSGGAGVPGTFTLTSPVRDTAAMTYSFNGDTPVTVRARGGHPVTIHWTPDSSGFDDLNVYITTKDGVQLPAYDYFFLVN